MTITKQEIEAAIEICAILGQAIKKAGPEGVPSGHLYAQVMSALSLNTYNTAIASLKRSGLISESHFVLTWIGD